MRSTIIVCSFNRPIQEQTRQLIGQMTALGAAFVYETNNADVAMARCKSLSHACVQMRELNKQFEGKRLPFDTFLMVDDDMLFTLDQVQELINYSRTNSVAVSAMYATMFGSLAAMPVETPIGEKQRWHTGLGLLAIPAWLLLKLEGESEEFEIKTGKYRAFTSSSCRDGKWFSEDYELCRRLGGVQMLPMAIGHLKTVPLYPDDVTVERVRSGDLIPSKLDGAELDALELEPRNFARNADGGRG